jgi:hypothetical protein
LSDFKDFLVEPFRDDFRLKIKYRFMFETAANHLIKTSNKKLKKICDLILDHLADPDILKANGISEESIPENDITSDP